ASRTDLSAESSISRTKAICERSSDIFVWRGEEDLERKGNHSLGQGSAVCAGKKFSFGEETRLSADVRDDRGGIDSRTFEGERQLLFRDDAVKKRTAEGVARSES